MDETLDQKINTENIIGFIWTKRKIILLITGIVGFISLIISLFTTPLYLSSAVVYPAATSTVSFSDGRNAKAASMDFGQETETEQLMQILESSRIKDKIIDRFDLFNHYEIDKTEMHKNYKLGLAYSEHIVFTRTRYGSIQIDVLDKNPVLAAKIANKIMDLIDTVKNDMIKERTVPAFEINKRKKELLNHQLKVILIKLDTLSELGVTTAEERANLFQAYNEARGEKDREFFKKQIDVNLKHAAEYDGLAMLRDDKSMKLAEFEVSYEQSESDANTNFNHKFIVEKAIVADKKEYPKKTLNVLFSCASAFLFSIFALLVQAKINTLRK
jgi:capsular polysaccharide biosynthesis protein